MSWGAAWGAPPRGRTVVAAAMAAVVAVAVGCHEVVTDQTVPVAIELDATPLPAVTVGDSLRDSTGAAVGLGARVFNSHGGIIADAPVHYLQIDSSKAIQLDTTTGAVVGLAPGSSQVIARLGTQLQSSPVTVTVVPSPDTLMAADAQLDTLNYRIGSDTLRGMRVAVGHHVSADSIVPVADILVHYRFLYPAGLSDSDTTAVEIVNDARRPALTDTTDATGTTHRSLRIAPFTHVVADSVVVEVTVSRPDRTALQGSPVVYRTVITIR